MRDYRSWCTRVAGAQRESLLAKCVVCPACRRYGWICIATGPRLDASIEIHSAALPAEFDESDAGDIDRHIQDEISTTHDRRQNAAEVLARQGLLDELDAVLLRL